MNQKTIICTLFVVIGIATIAYFILAKNNTPTPQVTQTVFISQEECEQQTGSSCSFQMCDYIPSGKTFEEVCGKDFKKGWVPVSDSKSPEAQSFSIDGRKIIDVVLNVDAPFSTAVLTIQNNNSVFYSAKQRSQDEIQDSSDLTSSQMNELARTIKDIDFLSMEDRPAGDDDPQDGSTYTITIRILPDGPPELADPGVYPVSCYQFACEGNFLKLKDKIIKLWGKEVLEVGV